MTETTNPYDFIEGQKVVVSEDAYYLYNNEACEAQESVRGKECYLTRFPIIGTVYGKYTATVAVTFGVTGTPVDAACLSHPLPPGTPAYGTADANVFDSTGLIVDGIVEPQETGAMVDYYDVEEKTWLRIVRGSKGLWSDDDGDYIPNQTWEYWVGDARPGSVRVVN